MSFSLPGRDVLTRVCRKARQFMGSTSEDTTATKSDLSAPAPVQETAQSLSNKTKHLLCRFFFDFTGDRTPYRCQTKALTTTRREVRRLLDKHRGLLDGVLLRSSLDEQEGEMTAFSTAARSVFSDGVINWGRVVSLIALGAIVSEKMKGRGKTDYVALPAQEISNILDEHVDWLLQNNGWDGYVEFFDETGHESAIWNSLVTILALAGIGTTMAWLVKQYI